MPSCRCLSGSCCNACLPSHFAFGPAFLSPVPHEDSAHAVHVDNIICDCRTFWAQSIALSADNTERDFRYAMIAKLNAAGDAAWQRRVDLQTLGRTTLAAFDELAQSTARTFQLHKLRMKVLFMEEHKNVLVEHKKVLVEDNNVLLEHRQVLRQKLARLVEHKQIPLEHRQVLRQQILAIEQNGKDRTTVPTLKRSKRSRPE